MATLESRLADVTLQSLVYGPADGPLAICLHGFPDTPNTFRHLAPHLVDLGYRVVAPFMRGYSPSSVSATHNYQVAALAGDASALHEVLGGDERAVLIGHDWGAAAAYAATAAEPDRWGRAVTMAFPPLITFAESMSNFEQLRASWYMFYLQSPMAEGVVRQKNFEFVSKLWAQWSPDYEADFDLGLVRESLQGGAHLRAALGYYSALFDRTEPIDPLTTPFRDSMFRPPTVPTIYLHGEMDGCFEASSIGDPLQHMAPGSEFDIVPGVGHFLHLERPFEVNQLIEQFLTR